MTNFSATTAQLNEGFSQAFGRTRTTPGVNASVTYYFNENVGIVADFAYHRKEADVSNSTNPIFFEDFTRTSRSRLSFLFGPQVKFNRKGRIQPFVRVMGGVVRQKNRSGLFFNNSGGTNPGGTDNPFETVRLVDDTTNFALAFGGGIDIRINKTFSIRAIQFDYIANFPGGRNAPLTAPTIAVQIAPTIRDAEIQFGSKEWNMPSATEGTPGAGSSTGIGAAGAGPGLCGSSDENSDTLPPGASRPS